ncbi:hypothetical protein EDC04DRAFT_2982498, partial [Pisolithus marmoratus]
RTLTHPAHSVALSRKKGYALGAKLVRGAYHPHETALYIGLLRTVFTSTDYEPPVYTSEVEWIRATTRVFQSSCAHSPRFGVLFGARNWQSSVFVLQESFKNELAHEEGRTNEPRTLVTPRKVVKGWMLTQLYGKHARFLKPLMRPLIIANRYGKFVVPSRFTSPIPSLMKCTPYGALGEVSPLSA